MEIRWKELASVPSAAKDRARLDRETPHWRLRRALSFIAREAERTQLSDAAHRALVEATAVVAEHGYQLLLDAVPAGLAECARAGLVRIEAPDARGARRCWVPADFTGECVHEADRLPGRYGFFDGDPVIPAWLSVTAQQERESARACRRDSMRLLKERVPRALGVCESEIEKELLWGLLTLGGFRADHPVARADGAIAWLPEFVFLYQQLIVPTPRGDYRLDFAIKDHNRRVALAIEADGHDFHDRTPEQAQRDKSRDRALMEIGFPVLRFTGREIRRDPRRCVDDVLANLAAEQRRHDEVIDEALDGADLELH
jgi:very-short-patch-repair endonuclease